MVNFDLNNSGWRVGCDTVSAGDVSRCPLKKSAFQLLIYPKEERGSLTHKHYSTRNMEESSICNGVDSYTYEGSIVWFSYIVSAIVVGLVGWGKVLCTHTSGGWLIFGRIMKKVARARLMPTYEACLRVCPWARDLHW